MRCDIEPVMCDSSSPLFFSRAPGKPKCRYGDDCYRLNPQHWSNFDHDDTHRFLQSVSVVSLDSDTEEDDAAASVQPPTPVKNVGSDTEEEEAEVVHLARCSPLREEDARTLASIVEEIVSLGTFRVGLIDGPTGSGKTMLLKALVACGIAGPVAEEEQWPKETPVVSHLASRSGGVQAAMSRLSTIGLNNVPAWVKPFGALSNGQQARCAYQVRPVVLTFHRVHLRHDQRRSRQPPHAPTGAVLACARASARRGV